MEDFEIEDIHDRNSSKSCCCWKFNYITFCFLLLVGFVSLVFYTFSFGQKEVPPVESLSHFLREPLLDDGLEVGCEEDYCLTKECISVAARMVTFLDETKDPCEDFYEYACGNYGELRSVRTGEYVYDPFTEVKDNIVIYIKKSMDSMEGITLTESFNKTRAIFETCMDHDARDENATATLDKFLANAGITWPILEDNEESSPNWTSIVAEMEKYGFHTLFVPKFTSVNNSQSIIMEVDCTVTTFPVDYYLNPSVENHADMVDWYHSVVTLFMHHLDVSRAEAKKIVMRISQLENDLAHALVSGENDASNDCAGPCPKAWCPPCKIRSVAERYPLSEDHSKQLKDIWSGLLHRSDLHIEVKSICEHNLEAAMTTLNQAPIKSVLNFVGWHAVAHLSQFMSTKFQDLYNHYVGRLLDAPSMPVARWRECSDLVRREMSLPVARAISEKNYINDHQIKEARKRFKDMIEAFKVTITTVPWLDNQTTSAFFSKLDKMSLQIGYPDYFKETQKMDELYHELDVNSSYSFFHNMMKLLAFKTTKRYSRFNSDDDKTKLDELNLDHTYLDTSSSYDYAKNQVYQDFGLLLPPIVKYGDGLPGYLEYGQDIIIAHEISHALDTKGIQYDSDGNLIGMELLPDVVKKNFYSFVMCLFHQLPYTSADTDNDIADLGSAFVASTGLHLHLLREVPDKVEKPLPVLPASKWKVFFIQGAQMFCQLQERKPLDRKRSVRKGPKERLNGAIVNTINFGDAFGCSIGTPMNPQHKCNLLSVGG